MNPFKKVAQTSPAHARNLAQAFVVAHVASDVAAALRMAQRLVGLASMPWLDGCHFASWVDSGGACMETMLGGNFELLRDLAWRYLDEPTSTSAFRF